MPSASGSMIAASPGPAIWIRQSCAQNVFSRMNSVSTVTKGALASRSQKAESVPVSVMIGCSVTSRCMGAL